MLNVQRSTFNSLAVLSCRASRDIAGFNFERFDSLTSRSLSLWPSHLCRGVPSPSILDSARNDKLTGGWTLGVRRWTLNSFYGRNRCQTAGANIARTRLGVFQ